MNPSDPVTRIFLRVRSIFTCYRQRPRKGVVSTVRLTSYGCSRLQIGREVEKCTCGASGMSPGWVGAIVCQEANLRALRSRPRRTPRSCGAISTRSADGVPNTDDATACRSWTLHPCTLRIMKKGRIAVSILAFNTCIASDFPLRATSGQDFVIACHLLRDHANVGVTGSDSLPGRIAHPTGQSRVFE